MEILMNIKCSVNGNASARPTLKVVDHHQQLQQQHNPLKIQRPPGPHPILICGKPNLSVIQSKETPLIPCMEYSSATPLDCCSAVSNPKSVTDLQWTQVNQKRTVSCNVVGTNPTSDCPPFCDYAPCCSGTEMLACCAGYNSSPGTTIAGASTMPTPHLAHSFLDSFFPLGSLTQHEANTSYEYHEPEENFVSIEDEKIKAFLLKIGEEQKLKESKQQKATPVEQNREDEVQAEPVVFEIIELDDVEEREKLQRIRASAEQRAKEKGMVSTAASEIPQSFLKSLPTKEKRKSPSISLIPKSPNRNQTDSEESSKPKEKIIARIDLLDSDTSGSEGEDNHISHGSRENNEVVGDSNDVEDDYDGENDDSASSRLIAAAAVSCELGCDDENDQESREPLQKNDTNCSSADDQIYVLHSEDEENIEFIEEQEEGLELRWDELEDHSNSRERQLFECPVCGKKVQSNYNLRRHMMIHTGERPFGCDLCERRFREISDLKKHRRRHATEKNFVCMICRINPPLETDSTRCSSCDTKNGTLIAAVRPDTVKTPPEIEQMFGTSLRADRRKLNITSNFNSNSSTEHTLVSPSTNLPPLTPIGLKPSLETTKVQSENTNPKTDVHSSNLPTLRAFSHKAFACPLCKRAFGTRHNLKRHFMIHTGEKPFNCPNCRKPFREYSTLKKHLVTHRRDRWYKCARCPQKYRDYLDYMEHKLTHGSDVSSDDGSVTPKKRFKYRNEDQEDAYFTNDEDEEGDGDDDDISTIDDCLECCECGQRFTEIDQFTEHIKEHDSNRVMYECYICKQLFEDHKDLVEHMNVKHETEETEDEQFNEK